MRTDTPKFKARLGLFVVIGFVIFALAIFLIGRQKHLFDPVFTVTATFRNISGLQVGNNVRFSGINVGTVDNIKIINDSTVQVDMIIKKSVQSFIKADSKATLGSEGLIGDKLITITQGNTSEKAVKSGQSINSIEPVELDAIIMSLNQTSKNVEVISNELVQIITKINTGEGTIARLIRDSTIAENINKVIINFEKTSRGLDENINIMMKSVNLTTENIRVSSQELAEIMKSVNQADGTIGKLIRDTVTANEIEQTIVNMKESASEITNTMEAINNSFLFRGYFKKKAKKEMLDSINSNVLVIPKKASSSSYK